MQIIIIRNMDGAFIKSLPDEFESIKNWFRSNSPFPSYPQYAKRFTLEKARVGDKVAPIDHSTEKKFTYEQYEQEHASSEKKSEDAPKEEKPATKATAIPMPTPRKKRTTA